MVQLFFTFENSVSPPTEIVTSSNRTNANNFDNFSEFSTPFRYIDTII